MHQNRILYDPLNRLIRIGDLIGKGGFAKVYEAEYLQSRNLVAVKEIPKQIIANQKLQERVNQEITIHKILNHPSVVKFYSSFQDAENIYMVLELCPGGNFEQYLRENGKLHEDEARKIVSQVANGIQYLQSKNIMHRDLKLSNILIDSQGAVRIADFGLATQLKRVGQKNTTMCGTPNYISPEVATRSPHDAKCDIWALGCILYTLLVGQPPFDTKEPKKVLVNVVMNDHKIPEWISSDARDLINKCLEKNPVERINIKSVMEHKFFDPIRLCNNDSTQRTDSGVCTLSTSGPSTQFSKAPFSAISEDQIGEEEYSQPCYNAVALHPALKQRSSPYRAGSPPVKLGQNQPYINKKFGNGNRLNLINETPNPLQPGYSHSPEIYRTDDRVSPATNQRLTKFDPANAALKFLSKEGAVPEISPKVTHQEHVSSFHDCWESHSANIRNTGNFSERDYLVNDIHDFQNGPLYYKAENYIIKDNIREKVGTRHGIVYDRGKQANNPFVPESADCKSARDIPIYNSPCHYRSASLDRLTENKIQVNNFQQCADLEKSRSFIEEPRRYRMQEIHRSWDGEDGQGLILRYNNYKDEPPIIPSSSRSCEDRKRIALQTARLVQSPCPPAHRKVSLPRQVQQDSTPPAHRESASASATKQSTKKENKTLSQICSPLSTRRLKATRQKTNNAILHILDNGEVCIEFLPLKKEENRVTVCRISHDGRHIVFYKAMNSLGTPVADDPPDVPVEGADHIFSYDSLPQKFFKKYMYAARFVKLVKAKTPKVTYYSDQAKCILMENGPNPDFEAIFFTGEKVILGKEQIHITDKNGKVKFSLALPEDDKKAGHKSSLKENSILQTLDGEMLSFYTHAIEIRDNCLQLEEILSNFETQKERPNFPVVIGKRPTGKRPPSSSSSSSTSPVSQSLKTPSQEKENVSPHSAPSMRMKFATGQFESYEPTAASNTSGRSGGSYPKIRKPLSMSNDNNIQKCSKPLHMQSKGFNIETEYGHLIEENGYIILRFFDGSYAQALTQSLMDSQSGNSVNENIFYYDSSNLRQSFYDSRGKLKPSIGHKLQKFYEVIGNMCRQPKNVPSSYHKNIPEMVKSVDKSGPSGLPKYIR